MSLGPLRGADLKGECIFCPDNRKNLKGTPIIEVGYVQNLCYLACYINRIGCKSQCYQYIKTHVPRDKHKFVTSIQAGQLSTTGH